MKSRKGVSAGVAVLGVLLGLVLGGGRGRCFFRGIDGNKSPAVTTTETRTLIESSSGGQTATVTEIIGNLPLTLTVTSTVTRNDSQSSRSPSMNLEATQLLYFQGQTVTLVGSIYPPPPSSAGIALTTRNPLGVVVQVGQAENRDYERDVLLPALHGYLGELDLRKVPVNATVGGQSATATFIYTASPSPRGPLLGLQVLASPVISAGQQVSIAILTSFPNGTLDDVTSWSTFAVLFPDGTFHYLCTPGAAPSICRGTFGRIHAGFYQLVFTLPGTAQRGTYYVEAAGSDSSGNSTRGAGQFSVP